MYDFRGSPVGGAGFIDHYRWDGVRWVPKSGSGDAFRWDGSAWIAEKYATTSDPTQSIHIHTVDGHWPGPGSDTDWRASLSSPKPPSADLTRGIASDPSQLPGKSIQQNTDATLTDFDRVSWQEFERLVGAGFQGRGYTVEATPDGADGGVDLNLSKGNERAAVQCKHWPNRRVGVDKVRQLFGVMQLTGVPVGYLVSSGDFTQDAWAEAQRCGVYLVRGTDTLALVNEAIAAGLAVPHLVEDPAPGVPRCPICREPMIVRAVRKGPNVGTTFWSCPRFPACRGSRPMPPSQPSVIQSEALPPSFSAMPAASGLIVTHPVYAQPPSTAQATSPVRNRRHQPERRRKALQARLVQILLVVVFVWIAYAILLPSLIAAIAP